MKERTVEIVDSSGEENVVYLTKASKVLNCTECGEPLPNEVWSSDGRAWHEECFTEEARKEALKKFPEQSI